tara:strand:- start:1991 stop:2530 length:540 start_codon:yes stop_codon:yes gene_type:complete
MAGELNLVSSTTVTSSVASVELTGIDTTYDIYKLVITNARAVNVAGAGWRLRWLVSGSAETGNNHFTQLMYHYGASDFTWSGIATDYRYSGNNQMYIGVGGADTGECYNANINLYKAYDSDSEGRFDCESSGTDASGNLIACKGGGYRKSKQSYNGVHIYCDGYNIASGFFGLYGYNYS